MKIVLNINEVDEILIDYLLSNGKLDNKQVNIDIHWHFVDNDAEESYVEYKQ
jgi:hypothetical protein